MPQKGTKACSKALDLWPHRNGRSPSNALDLGDFQGAAPLEPSEILNHSFERSELLFNALRKGQERVGFASKVKNNFSESKGGVAPF